MTTAVGAAYMAAIDAAIAALAPSIDFSPHAVETGSPAPDMGVEIDAGGLLVGEQRVLVASQIVRGFSQPASGKHRIDRVVLDPRTGVASRIAGTEATGSPTATPPAITIGSMPLARVLITNGDVAIQNSAITDERSVLSKNGHDVLLATASPTGVEVAMDFTGLTGYRAYRLRYANIKGDAASGVALRISTNNGVSFDASSVYSSMYLFSDNAGSSFVSGSSGLSRWTGPAFSSGSTVGEFGEIFFTGFEAGSPKSAFGRFLSSNGGGAGSIYGFQLWSAQHPTTQAVDAIRFTSTGGTAHFTNGTFQMHGIR